MNASNNKRLHVLLSQTGLMAQKANMVFGFSAGRTESSRQLTEAEMKGLIMYLEQQKSGRQINDSANRMRRKVISMAHEMHWHLSGTVKIDMIKINTWCIKYSYLHKKLNDYSLTELPKLVSQFESVYKDYLNRI